MIDKQPTPLGRKVARRLLLVLGMITIIISIGLLCFYPFAKNLGWQEAQTTSRQILGDNCGNRRTGFQPWYGYIYTVNGKNYTTSDCSPSVKNVVYFPANPSISFNEGRNDYLYLLVFVFMGGAVIAIARLFK